MFIQYVLKVKYIITQCLEFKNALKLKLPGYINIGHLTLHYRVRILLVMMRFPNAYSEEFKMSLDH